MKDKNIFVEQKIKSNLIKLGMFLVDMILHLSYVCIVMGTFFYFTNDYFKFEDPKLNLPYFYFMLLTLKYYIVGLGMITLFSKFWNKYFDEKTYLETYLNLDKSLIVEKKEI